MTRRLEQVREMVAGDCFETVVADFSRAGRMCTGAASLVRMVRLAGRVV